MYIKQTKENQLGEKDVTPESVYNNRRQVIKALGFGASLLAAPSLIKAETKTDVASDNSPDNSATSKSETATNTTKSTNYPINASGQKLTANKSTLVIDSDKLVITAEDKILSHNNFYELGTAKTDPKENADKLKTQPWTLTVSGEVNNPFTLDVWDLINKASLEERIYRMRCVEAWSMVIPWLGIELQQIIKRAQPNSRAKYVAFETIYDPKQLPGQASSYVGGSIKYPYVEGLRIDEAMHRLTLLSVGLYGKTLAVQNGAPIRLVVPWKYGFKNIKSIVGIKLVEKMPATSWNLLAPNEYGFYANVNPQVDHTRWSQASERFIGKSGLFSSKRQKTLMFNGYANEVASLYSDMDLRKWF